MPMRSTESRSRWFDQAAFLSVNEIAEGLRGTDADATLNLRVRLEFAVGALMEGSNPENPERAARFLCDFRVLAARVALEPSLRGVLSDLERTALRLGASRATEIELLRDALRRSSGILRLAPDQLPEQILGRLGDRTDGSLGRLVQRAMAYKPGCWLRPVTASFRGAQEVVGYLDGHAAAACFVPSGLLLTIDSSGWLQCWDPSGGRPPVRFRTGQGEPTGLASDGTLAAVPTRDGPIHVVELSTGRRRAPLHLSATGATLAVAFIKPGILASGGTDGQVRLWEVDGGREIDRIDLHDLAVHVLLPLGEDRLVAGTDPDPGTHQSMQIWICGRCAGKQCSPATTGRSPRSTSIPQPGSCWPRPTTNCPSGACRI
jgi:hypothetical protein